MREENDGPTVSVKSFEEVKKGTSYSAPRELSSEPKKVAKPSVSFGKGVFGSMSVEDLKSRGFVRESVQKVNANTKTNANIETRVCLVMGLYREWDIHIPLFDNGNNTYSLVYDDIYPINER